MSVFSHCAHYACRRGECSVVKRMRCKKDVWSMCNIEVMSKAGSDMKSTVLFSIV